MARILQISKLGHPVLRTPCPPVPPEEILRPAFQEFLDDMIATMRENRGIGLAAPQVFVSRQVAVIERLAGAKGEGEAETPLAILINPELAPVGTEVEEDWEGCLSIDDLRGLVPRWHKVTVKALGRDGKKIALKAQGFHARVLQHECDHLAGTLYLDRMKDLKSLMHLAEFQRFSERYEAPRRRKS
jgi:peptide deformylase